MKSKYLEIILAIALIAVVVSAFATTWTENTSLNYFGSVGMSADGRIICAVASTSYPVISTNWGQTWTVTTNVPNVSPDLVAVSADGKIFLPCATNGSALLISTNCGNTWLALLATNSGFAGRVACSADGTELLAGIASRMFFSTNSGVNWYTSSAPANFSSLASSADARLMVGAANGGSIYFSTNFGANWTSTNLPAHEADEAVCVSSDGNSVGASGISTGTSYISSNAGINWRSVNIGGRSIACSAHGTNWVIAGTAIYTSIDGGITWQTNFPGPPVNWYGSAVSADGCEFMIVGTGGIATGYNTPSPQLNIQPADQALNLSWLLPSTNFVLQRNSDLTTTNWTAVSNSPVLNFTNLQQQVRVPSSPNNAFFRLVAQ